MVIKRKYKSFLLSLFSCYKAFDIVVVCGKFSFMGAADYVVFTYFPQGSSLSVYTNEFETSALMFYESITHLKMSL